MRVPNLGWLAGLCLVIAGCTNLAPEATPLVSAPVSSLPLPLESAPAASVPPETATPTAETTPKPRKSPKPTKQPTASPSPSPERTPADIEVRIEESTIPNPFYNNTDYTIRVYISALGTQDIPNAHVTLVAKDEGVSFEFDTGPIAITDSYYHDIEHVNLPATGPSTLTLTGKLPSDYNDTNKANNTKSVDITVTLAP